MLIADDITKQIWTTGIEPWRGLLYIGLYGIAVGLLREVWRFQEY